MSVTALASASIIPTSQPGLASAVSLAGSEEILIDYEIPASSTALGINIGIASTSKVKGFMLMNAGTADITALTLDAGTVDKALKVGEVLFVQGSGLSKKELDNWSGATTMLVLKATTPAGSAKAKLKGVIIVDP